MTIGVCLEVVVASLLAAVGAIAVIFVLAGATLPILFFTSMFAAYGPLGLIKRIGRKIRSVR